MAVDSHRAQPPGWQHRVQHLLQAGLALSAVLIAAGFLLAMMEGQHRAFSLRAASLLSDGTFAERVIALGLLVLSATPVLRVVALIVIWYGERDRRFVLLGLVVLTILLGSAVTGSG